MKTSKQKPLSRGEKEVYLLKIYRRGKKPDDSLAGTIEEIAKVKSDPIFSTKLNRLNQKGG